MAAISNNDATSPSTLTTPPAICSYLSKIAHEKVATGALGWFASIAHWFLTTFSCFYPAYDRFYNTLLVEAKAAGQGIQNQEGEVAPTQEISQAPAASSETATVEQSLFFEVGPHVEGLDLTNKHLTELPESIRQCTNLKRLFLNNNQLTTLPDWLSELPLTQLEVEHNPLTTIPPCVFQMPELETVSFHGAGDVGGPGMVIDRKVFKAAKENLQKLKKLGLSYCALDNSFALKICCQKWLPQCKVEVYGNRGNP